MTPTVSVITPCGAHHAKYIRGCAESVTRSTVPFLEHIIIDDAADPPVPVDLRTYRYDISSGRSRARNMGLVLARGEWVYFLDADDELLPETHQHFLDAYAAGPLDMFYGEYIIREPGRTDHRFHQAPWSHQGLRETMIMNIGYFVRSDRARLIDGFDELMNFGEDRDFALRYTANPKIIVVKSEHPQFIFRRGDHSSPYEVASRSYGDATIQITEACRAGYYDEWETV